MKKIISILMVLTMCIGLISCAAKDQVKDPAVDTAVLSESSSATHTVVDHGGNTVGYIPYSCSSFCIF